MKRGTLLKVRHDGTALLIHSFSSHISSQGMGCAIVATASAGTAGQGTLAKSGWERSTEEDGTMRLETRGPRARRDQEHRRPVPTKLVKHPSPETTGGREEEE